jgi:hypothetical protein
MVRSRRLLKGGGRPLKLTVRPGDLMLSKYSATVARWIFSLWYLASGATWLITHALGRGTVHREVAPGAAAFQLALAQSQFMNPLLALTCLLGGAALLVRRTSPLGIVILLPVVVVIFLFHLVLSGNWVWGTLNLVWFAALAWSCRRAFTTLWHYTDNLGASDPRPDKRFERP